jgi:addiction module RelE/StbE family toxin
VRIEWTDRALTDLAAVYGYIAADNEAAARQVIAAIRKTVDRLEMFPALGRRSRNPLLRELVVDQYIVVYAVRRDRVVVIRVWHGAQRRL